MCQPVNVCLEISRGSLCIWHEREVCFGRKQSGNIVWTLQYYVICEVLELRKMTVSGGTENKRIQQLISGALLCLQVEEWRSSRNRPSGSREKGIACVKKKCRLLVHRTEYRRCSGRRENRVIKCS